MGKQWIGVDLDGTLAYSSTEGKIGKPVPSMMARVKQAVEDGTEIRIFTVRAATTSGRDRVVAWLKQHGLGKLVVTDRKDGDMLEIWDDRARRVQRNKGEFCAGCATLKLAVMMTDC